MTREIRNNLIVAYITLIAMAIIAAVLIQIQHQLSVWIALELAGFVVIFSLAWTWFSLRDERKTKARIQEVQGDLEAFGMQVIKQCGDIYSVTTSGVPNTPIEDNLDLAELEAFTRGVAAGWRISTYDDEQETKSVEYPTDLAELLALSEQEVLSHDLTIVGTMIPSDTPPEALSIGLQLIDSEEWIYSGG